MLLITTAPSYIIGYHIDMWTNRSVSLIYLTCLLIQVVAMATSELHHTQTNLHLLIDYHHHSRIGTLIDQTVWAVLYTLIWNAVEMCQRLWGPAALTAEQEAEHRRLTRPLLPSPSPSIVNGTHVDTMSLMPLHA
jgi:hypothetical protein